MKVRKIGGRPPKPDSERRRFLVTIKLNESEYNHLVLSAKSAGIDRSEYARQAIRKGKIRSRLTLEMMDLIRKLCGMANNLNQIARQANTTGYDSIHSEYFNLAHRIDDLLNQIRR